jgi:hypothetical protein
MYSPAGPGFRRSHEIASVISFTTVVANCAVNPGSTANVRSRRYTGSGICCRRDLTIALTILDRVIEELLKDCLIAGLRI